MKTARNKAFWVALAVLSPIAFIGGIFVENLNRSEPTGYSLGFFGHRVYCLDENLTIDIYVENTGDAQFTKRDIDIDEWFVHLTGENVSPKEVSVFRTQLGGIEPGESGYLIAYVGTYQEDFAKLDSISLGDSSGEVWTERIHLGPTVCLGSA